jgi:hypothetical protein
MNIIESIKSRTKNRIKSFVNSEVQKSMEYMLPQLLQFHNSAKEERQSYHDHTNELLENVSLLTQLKGRLMATGISVDEVDIDINDFEHWLSDLPAVNDYYRMLDDVHIEKCLEHYLAYRFLNISKNDLYIDIAARGSPWADIMNKRGIKSYRLDLIYPAGFHGINIGADAGDTKLPDEFATVLSAQCAYECFMGDADIRFVKEAARILKHGGRCAIVPLYLDGDYYVLTSPYCNQNEVVIEPEAKRVWRDDTFIVPFSRHYSPESFYTRIFSAIPASMSGKVLYFRNLPDIMKHFERQRIYCFFMFCCEKK